MDQDQTAPRGSGSTLFAKMTFKITRQMTIVVIGSLKVKEFLVIIVRFFSPVLHKSIKNVVGTH